MSHTTFHILYDGPALSEHRMEVRDLAPALLALGVMLEEANSVLNGDHARLSVSVKGSFKTGSFGIDLNVGQTVVSQVIDFFNNSHITGAVNLLTLLGFAVTTRKGLLGLVKWVRNRKIRRVEILNTDIARVFIDDEHLDVEQDVIKLYQHHKLRKALEDVIVKPLDQEGIETFAVKVGESETFVEISKTERSWFISPEPDDTPLDETVFERNLQLVNVAFRDDNKWRFSDGVSTFYAAILDQNFLSRVQQNQISFSRNDILRVRLNMRQWLHGEDMKTDYEVLEVIEHRRAASQLKLPFD